MATKKKSITKEDLFASVVDITAKHGQGIPLFMLRQEKEVQDALDALIIEKKVKIVTKSYSHLPDDETICLEGVYCVEEEISNSGGMISHLSFLRHFIGSSEMIPMFGKTDTEIAQSEEGKPLYEAWLEENKEGLEALLSLKKTPIKYTIDKFNDSEKEFLLSMKWYTDNKSIEESLTTSKELIENLIEQVNVTQKIINLTSGDLKYEEELISHIEKNKKNNLKLDIIKKIDSIMKCMNKKHLTQDAFKNFI